MWPKCFQRQTEAAWKPKQACEGVWHLMIEWEGGLSFTRCGMQVQIVLLHCDWWRDVHHPLRVRDEEREGVRVYRPQQIDVRLRTISQNRMKSEKMSILTASYMPWHNFVITKLFCCSLCFSAYWLSHFKFQNSQELKQLLFHLIALQEVEKTSMFPVSRCCWGTDRQ